MVSTIEFAPNISIERRLLEFVKAERVDEAVLDVLLPKGRPLDYETALWDYKTKLPNTLGKIVDGADDPDDTAVSELVKDVVSFYNSYGGYILGGVGEFDNDPIKGCPNSKLFAFRIEKLNEKVASYVRTTIKCRAHKFNIDVDGQTRCVNLILVPRRPANTPVARFVKGAPEGKKQSFQKGDVFARVDDRCVAARVEKAVIPFVCSGREIEDASAAALPVDNNLPPRDPNLVRFVGRTEYLDELWWWMVDRTMPLKVLTALGGTGKTSIAYEFCGQVAQNKPSWLEKVVWLSAKRQTYSAIQGKTYSATRVDFYDINSFWCALSDELGCSEGEILNCESQAELIELAFEALSELPCIIVVDDIDTLALEQQSELFSQIQMLSGRVFEGGSRFLITSRLEFGGLNQKIKVAGFPLDEFNDYVKILEEETGIGLSTSLQEALWKASLGSPIFAASMFRLARLGTPMSAAIKAWKGRDGEDVRRFAFAREIDQLSDAECRTLYALITLGETMQLELAQVLEIDQFELTKHLSRIREYHLFAANDASLKGAKLVVPGPILMMSDIVKQRINDPKRIEKECARARNQNPRDDNSVAFVIGQIIAFWKEDDFDSALELARAAFKRNPKSSDLPCMLGRCLLKIDPPKAREADKAFRAAFENGCTRIELAPLWIDARRQLDDWVGISEIAGMLPRSDIRGSAALTVALAEANLGMQAASRSDTGQSIRRFKQAMIGVQLAIQEGRADDSLPSLREIARESARRYVTTTHSVCERAGDKISVFNATMDAFGCHISEASILLLGATSLHEWARDVFGRKSFDASAAEILDTRITDLDEMIQHVEDAPFDRHNLAATLRRISLRLKEDLHAYKAQFRRTG